MNTTVEEEIALGFRALELKIEDYVNDDRRYNTEIAYEVAKMGTQVRLMHDTMRALTMILGG